MEYPANRIRSLRRQLGFTQRQLGELLGVTFVTISRWESNRVQPNRLALRALSALVQNVDNPRSVTHAADPAAVPGPSSAYPSTPLLTAIPLARNETGQPPKEDHTALDVPPVRNEIAETLKKSKIFSVLNNEQCIQLSKIIATRQLKAQQFLFHEGDPLEHFYIMSEGRMKIFVHSPSGVDFIMGFSGPGGIFGNIALVSGKPHTSSARAITDSKVLAIKNDDLITFLANHPDVGFKIFRRMLISLSIRLTNLMRRITDMATETAEYRIAYILIRLFVDFGSNLPFTREEIAQMAGTATETAIRILNRFSSKGIVRPGRHNIIVLDPVRLRALLETSHRH